MYLYGYVLNNTTNFWDPFGLCDYSEAETKKILDKATADSQGPLGLYNM